MKNNWLKNFTFDSLTTLGKSGQISDLIIFEQDHILVFNRITTFYKSCNDEEKV